MIAGTGVLQDWVELPSQLYEHWLERPEILTRFAVHYRTGEPMPADLLRRLIAARTFNLGCATLEYSSSALLDLDLHLRGADAQPQAQALDIDAFEQATLARLEMPPEIVMRHRPPHFTHIFGGGYAAGYLPPFARPSSTTGAAAPERDPRELYLAFRGRMPTPDGLLKRRGLLDAPQ